MFMCVSICMSAHMCVSVCVSAHMYVYVRLCECMHMCVYVYVSCGKQNTNSRPVHSQVEILGIRSMTNQSKRNRVE